MKEIDEYIKHIYKHINVTNQEIANLKEEMKNHLLESVYELQAEGKSPQESIRIAIERFGESTQLNKELPKIIMISRRRFSRCILLLCGMALVILVVLSLIISDNFSKQNKLNQAELTKQKIIQDLQQSQISIRNYDKIFGQISEISAVYKDSVDLSKDLKSKYNTAVIDQIAKMNKTFKYHNSVLLAVAIVAADTDYECPYYKDIAELAVMKLSDSASVIDLAEKTREAKTEEDKKIIVAQIQQMKENAYFKTYQQALDYNAGL